MSLWNVKAHELRNAQAKLLLEIARETATEETKLAIVRGATPAGEEERLRGWPVVGAPGVGGAQRGSRPGSPPALAKTNETHWHSRRPRP
jgi:hypothetical protein